MVRRSYSAQHLRVGFHGFVAGLETAMNSEGTTDDRSANRTIQQSQL